MVVLFSAALFAPSGPASAFELFGKKLIDTGEEETTVADPVWYEITFTQTGLSSDEEAALRAASELIAGIGSPVSGSLGLLVKAKADRDLLIAALYEQARYSGLVRVFIAGKDITRIDSTAEFDTTAAVPVEIRIEGRQKFHFGRVQITGDTQTIAPAEFGLVTGEPAYSNLILDAQTTIVSQLNASGHPYAEISNADVEADHDRGTLDVSFNVRAGPLAHIGGITVEGNDTVDGEFIREYAAVAEGELYAPEQLEAIRNRLLELGVFSAVTISPGKSLNERGEVPLIIEVTERKHRYFGVGATYSNAEGLGVEGYWGHRNLNGKAESLRIEGGISRISETTDLSELNYNAAILFEKPNFYDPASTFSSSLEAVSENYDAFERRSVRGGFKIIRNIDALQSLTAGVDLDLSRITEENVRTSHLIVSTPVSYAFDGSNNPFNPTRGSRVLLEVEPGHDLESGTTFVKAKASLSAYHAVSENVVLAGRTAVGTIVGANLNAIPADRRFYAGGGGSVRGFEYQALGPLSATGRPTGGLSLFEASLEARIQVTDTVGIVPFIDAGSIANSRSPDFSDIRYGAGVGVRYQTPFGPLRVDVGVPLNRRANEDRWGIYAGIGQAF